MEIKYKKKRLRLNLVLAIVWLTLTIAQVYFADNIFLLVGWILIGLLNFSQMAYRYFVPYLTLKEGSLIVHEFLNNSSIELSEITKIKRFAGDYILKNNRKELTVNTQLIEPKALAALDTELEKLNIKWE